MPIVKGTPFQFLSNFTLPSAPPVRLLPDANGFPLPAGLVSWKCEFDVRNIPNGEPLVFAVEFQFDNPRLNPPVPLAFYPLLTCHITGGPQTNRQGVSTFMAGIQGPIGAIGADGNLYHNYPQAVRVRVDASGGRLIPSAFITCF
jgi:hypothetical protein